MIIYLYKKTHNVTGLQYLGKTTRNPYNYKGSGKIWIPHLKKHGYDVTTEIIKECHSVEDIRYWGVYYSDLWNVVKDSNWANLKPEEGDGFASGEANPSKREDLKRLRSDNWSGDKNPACLEKNKKYGNKNVSKREEVKSKLSGNNHYMKRDDYDKSTHNSKNPETLSKRSGDNHWMKQKTYDPKSRPNYDSTVYIFFNKSLGLTESLTKFEFRTKYKLNPGSVVNLVKGKSKSCYGWIILN